MTLKNRLLLAFLFVGIIPSILLGFLILYESNETIELLENKRMLEHMKSLSDNTNSLDKYNYDNEMTILIQNGDITNIEEESPEYIESIREDDDYIEYENIRIGKIDNKLYGVLYDEDNNCNIYHFHNIIGINSSLTNIGPIFIKTSLIIITVSIGLSLGLSYNITSGITKLINYTKKLKKESWTLKYPWKRMTR